MKFLGVLLSIIILLAGCATAYKISRVQIGMTKEEVIRIMGRPVSTSVKENIEYLNYSLAETTIQALNRDTKPYFVRLVNGQVDSFGRLGDFDSTPKPTVRIDPEENIKIQSDIKKFEKPDLYSELMKLKQLRDEGLITQEEFEKEKKELLEK